MRHFVLALLLSSTAVLDTASGFAAPALGIEDIPHIIAAGEAGFNRDYKGRLYTARMTVNDVLDRSTYFAIGFNSDGKHEMFPPISCTVHDLGEIGPAREGKILWVSGILDDLMGSTIFLDPCEISFTQEPWTQITSLSDYAKHIKHRWVKYGEERNQTSYIDLASIIRTGDTLTVLDMQDWNPPIEVGTTGEHLGSDLSLMRYDCGSTPRSMILAGVTFHGHMGSGTQQEGAADVPSEPSSGWYVMPARTLDGKDNGMLKARDMACNGLSSIQ